MSRPLQLLLPRQLYNDMIVHAQSALPNECCGILAGTIGPVLQVEKRYPLINEAASPIRYSSEPRSMFLAIKDMRTFGYEIVAIYHSHPTSAPIPSRTDLEQNYSSEVVNFIISLQDATPSVRGWWLAEDGFAEAEWQIVEA